MKNRICCFIAILLAFLACSTLLAQTFQGQGSAFIFGDNINLARKQAFYNAKRDIINQQINQFLSQASNNKEKVALEKYIFSKADVYLKQVNILEATIRNQEYILKIQALVNDQILRADLLENGILNITKEPEKVFIFYYPQNDNSFTNSSQVAQIFLNTIKEIKKEFNWVYSDAQNNNLIDLDFPTITEILKDNDYNSLIVVDLYPLNETEEDFVFQKYGIGLNASIYELGINEINQNIIQLPFYSNAKKETLGQKEYFNFYAKYLAQLFSNYANNYLSNYYKTDKSIKYTLELDNFNKQELELMNALLKDLEGYEKSSLQLLGNKAKIIYFSFLSSDRLYYNVVSLMNEAEIYFQLQERSYLTIHFSKS